MFSFKRKDLKPRVIQCETDYFPHTTITSYHFTFLFIVNYLQGAAMDVDDDEDLVPEITKRHFEEAMKFARRCVLHSITHCFC